MSEISKREDSILRILAQNSEVSVQQLSEELDVSQVTIRADLRNLDAKGLAIRTRGGAVSASNSFIQEKQNSNLQAKTQIAKAAAEFVKDGDSIMICNGTTSALVARYLLGKSDIHLVTNSTLILPYARANSALHVTMIGGEFRPSAEGMVGSTAEHQLHDFHVNIAFLGTEGITIEHGLTTANPENADIIRAMCSQADKTILVADSSKYGVKGFVRIIPTDKIDVFITDKNLPKEAIPEFEKIGVKTILV